MAAAKLDIAIVRAAVEQALKEAGIVSEELADPTGLSKPKAKRKPRKVTKVKDVPGSRHECWKLIGADRTYAAACEGQTATPATNPMLAKVSRDIIEGGGWDELQKLYKKFK